MTVEERLRALYEALPLDGAVTLNRSALGDMLGTTAGATIESGRRDLTTNEVAEIYQVTPGTVLAWLHQGQFGIMGSGWYKLGRRYLVRETAIRAVGSSQHGLKREVLRLPRRGPI